MDKYVVLSGKYIENVLEKLNSDQYSSYRVVGTVQEFGVIKVILEKE